MDSGDSFLFIILIILLMLSAFFSSSETALMTVNKIRLRSLADEGNKRAAMVLDITENHTSKMLSAILIGNNIVNIPHHHFLLHLHMPLADTWSASQLRFLLWLSLFLVK